MTAGEQMILQELAAIRRTLDALMVPVISEEQRQYDSAPAAVRKARDRQLLKRKRAEMRTQGRVA